MKFHCDVDGVHFKQDFDKTLIPPCNFWGDFGLSNLPLGLKQKFWDWLFSMPSDEISFVGRIAMGVTFTATPIKEENLFVNVVPGYTEWSEERQQDFQREYFKAIHAGQNGNEFLEQFKNKIKPVKLIN